MPCLATSFISQPPTVDVCLFYLLDAGGDGGAIAEVLLIDGLTVHAVPLVLHHAHSDTAAVAASGYVISRVALGHKPANGMLERAGSGKISASTSAIERHKFVHQRRGSVTINVLLEMED